MATASAPILYRKNDSKSNKILRLALLNAWGATCYWCGQPRQFSQVEIDHVIPRSLSKAKQDQLVEQLLGPAAVRGYEVDAPYNLGPICPSPCNREKSASLYSAPRFVDILKRTKKKVSQVENFIEKYKAAGRAAEALALVVSADLSDSSFSDALVEFAPLLDSRLRVVDFTTTDEIYDPGADAPELVAVTLDRTGRRVRDVLETLSGQDIDEALAEPIRTVRGAISDRLLGDLTSQVQDAGHFYPEVAPPTTRMALDVTNLRYTVEDEQFEMVGTFDADGVAEAAVMGANGEGLDYLQREAEGHGTFAVRFWCTRGTVESDDFVGLEWNDGPSPTPRQPRFFSDDCIDHGDDRLGPGRVGWRC
ncbi:HNH endonuclease [Nocardia sp. XZ_19_369]|uniref:HNH endonuclease n=1 Tax=Nocardia sp. XZ_19_369 TaxID=2769487 RepID=UPI0018909626|nr:hypothetical protein [Nocardia sp. XZ_19_369]